MSQTNYKIWPVVARALVGAAVFTASFHFAGAQSSSSSYQAVDFLNAEASNDSSSANYVLNDSVDYYGGIHSSAGYNECTGDYAVLSGCQPTVPPPPPPPPPPGGGGTTGGSGSTNICDYVDCEGDETSEEIPDPSSDDEPFQLPDITEPITIVTPTVVEPPVVPAISPPPLLPEVRTEEVTQLSQPIDKIVRLAGAELLHKVAPEYCYDLTCTEARLFRPAAPELKKGIFNRVCRLYTFGAFMFDVNCSDAALIWVAIGLLLIAPMPVGLLEVHRRLRKLSKGKK